jgi:hypothetical protein
LRQIFFFASLPVAAAHEQLFCTNLRRGRDDDFRLPVVQSNLSRHNDGSPFVLLRLRKLLGARRRDKRRKCLIRVFATHVSRDLAQTDAAGVGRADLLPNVCGDFAAYALPWQRR